MNYFATGAHAYNVYVIQSSATTCSRLNKIYNRKKINKNIYLEGILIYYMHIKISCTISYTVQFVHRTCHVYMHITCKFLNFGKLRQAGL